MKIVYCLNSIRYTGGIQRVTIVKANALAEIDGNDIYVVVTDNKEGPIVQALSPKVHLIDLDVNYYYKDKERSPLLNHLVVKYINRTHKKSSSEIMDRTLPFVVFYFIKLNFIVKYYLSFRRLLKIATLSQVSSSAYHTRTLCQLRIYLTTIRTHYQK